MGSGRVLIKGERKKRKKNPGKGKGASFQPFFVKVYVNGIFVELLVPKTEKSQKNSYYLLGHRHTNRKFWR